MKAALYARVSTVDQDCAMQLRELREYCKRRGWEIAGEYVDTGWSGAKASRPEFNKLKADAAQHLCDAVLTWKLDRFGRSVQDCINGISTLRSQGIRFMATSQNIDTDESNPVANLIMHILAAVAEFEREMIRERVMAGLKNARAKGVKLGRKQVVFDRARALEMRRRGLSTRAIGQKLGISAMTVHRALKSAPTAVTQPPADRPSNAVDSKGPRRVA
jgi:putative DNA-invertase from lambdoid prophage Rac